MISSIYFITQAFGGGPLIIFTVRDIKVAITNAIIPTPNTKNNGVAIATYC